MGSAASKMRGSSRKKETASRHWKRFECEKQAEELRELSQSIDELVNFVRDFHLAFNIDVESHNAAGSPTRRRGDLLSELIYTMWWISIFIPVLQRIAKVAEERHCEFKTATSLEWHGIYWSGFRTIVTSGRRESAKAVAAVAEAELLAQKIVELRASVKN